MQALQDQMIARDPQAHRVYVGDYVDRGDHSADVLRALLAQRDDPQVTCLIGNHEDMLLGFLDDPAKKGARYLRYGGLQTLASFGIGGVTATSEAEAITEAATALSTAMGTDMIAWLRGLPTLWQTGNLAVVHAGADPAMPLSMQADKILKWGHPDFDNVLRTDGHWVAHGHTIVDEAHATDGKIAVDTGAYATGRLTAAYVSHDGVQFLQAG